VDGGVVVKTFWMLFARYEGRPAVPAEEVCRDFFGHLDTPKFIRKVDAGDIDLPLIRSEASAKAARLVQLTDLAAYIDARSSEARDLNDKLHGRKVRQANDNAA
jgi:hypothetical protein